MHHVKLRFYEYADGNSFTLHFGGYNYAATPSWYNTFAYIEGNAATDRNFNVRFGYDGSKMVVYIGELASTWSYPQIFIDEVGLGYTGQSTSWSNGTWTIGFETSTFQNVTSTVSNTNAHNFARNGTSAYYNIGSVAIGKTTPNAILDVNGNTIITGSLTTTGTVTAAGGGFDSDLTLKNVISRDLSTHKIANQISVIKYNWKDSLKGTTQRFGYGAQELLSLIPEAVYKNGDHYAVDYTQVHTILIDENTKRIQELEKEVSELKELINKLINK